MVGRNLQLRNPCKDRDQDGRFESQPPQGFQEGCWKEKIIFPPATSYSKGRIASSPFLSSYTLWEDDYRPAVTLLFNDRSFSLFAPCTDRFALSPNNLQLQAGRLYPTLRGYKSHTSQHYSLDPLNNLISGASDRIPTSVAPRKKALTPATCRYERS